MNSFMILEQINEDRLTDKHQRWDETRDCKAPTDSRPGHKSTDFKSSSHFSILYTFIQPWRKNHNKSDPYLNYIFKKDLGSYRCNRKWQLAAC